MNNALNCNKGEQVNLAAYSRYVEEENMDQRRILVVDDEPDLVHAVRLYLEMEDTWSSRPQRLRSSR